MSTRFEQISQNEIPSYTGEVATDIGFESIGEVTTTGSPNFPTKTKWESEPDPVTTVQRKRGAHLEVIDALSGITFVPGSACQMSQAIAYIRYWSRGGVQQRGVTQEESNYKPNDPAEVLGQSVSSLYTDPNIDFQTTRSVLYPLTNFSQRAFTGVPINTFNPSLDLSTPSQTTLPTGSAVSGSVYNANPGSNSLGYSYTDAVWMFLFNPEELQLSSGPDYNRADTWGVSDPNNSGQPLSWRSNRNRKLSFGKVLLHGYTFGKRVDTLESGLQQLFMAREGEGSDGPPVLEFVWGKRIFGPCVIQNIQVREKAWDKGILVNAEVSFELEQVPEWTINDGEVDILRPGRQPLVNDPILPQGQYNQPEGDPGGDKPPANQPGGGNPQQVDVASCALLYRQRKLINDIEFLTVKLKSKPLSVVTQRGSQQGRPLSNKNSILRIFDSFNVTSPSKTNQLLNEAREKVKIITDSRECKSETYRQSFEYALDQAYQSGSDFTKKIKNIDNYYTDFAIKCIKSYKKVVDEAISKAKCSSSPYRTPTGKVNGRPVQGPGLF